MAVPFPQCKGSDGHFSLSVSSFISHTKTLPEVLRRSLFARWRNSSGVIVWRFVGCIEKCFYQDFCRFFCGMHQTEGQGQNQTGGGTYRVIAQIARSYFFISSLVAAAISLPPGTIHGTTPIPDGNTTRTTRLPSPRVRG